MAALARAPMRTGSLAALFRTGGGSWVRPVVTVCRAASFRAASFRAARPSTCLLAPRPPLACSAARQVGLPARRMSAASAAPQDDSDEEYEELDDDEQLEMFEEEEGWDLEPEDAYTAAEVDAAVAAATDDVSNFESDLGAKFAVLGACAAALGGHRVPNAQLHAVSSKEGLSAYYKEALVPDASLPEPLDEDELPSNLILDDRDEEMISKVLTAAARE